MSRYMSHRMAGALQEGLPLAILAELDHPDGFARFWSGVGTVSWNGYSWTGAGHLGAVRPIQYSSELAIQEIEFVLAGTDPTIVSRLSDNVRNRAAKVWLAVVLPDGTFAPDPVQIVDAQMDFQSQKTGDDGSIAIVISARTGFYTLEREARDVWSSEDQKRLYPTDSGLELLTQLQNQDLTWGPA